MYIYMLYTCYWLLDHTLSCFKYKSHKALSWCLINSYMYIVYHCINNSIIQNVYTCLLCCTCTCVLSLLDYQEWLDTAAREGVVDTQWSNVSIGGASGTGKSSFVNLLLLKEPVLIHDSTPVLKSLDVCYVDNEKPLPEAKCKTMEKQEEVSDEEQASSSDDNDDDGSGSTAESSSDSSEDIPETVKEMRQHMILADPSENHLWKITEKEEYHRKLAEAVSALAKEEKIPEYCPSRLPPYCPQNLSSDVPNSDLTEVTESIVRPQPIALTPKKLTARQKILDLLPLVRYCSTLGRTHWIHLLDTGGQANFIDIAPALFRFNSVNIILHKLDEDLDDFANFFYSIGGEVVGGERRRITNAQLLRSLFASRMGLKKPNLEGLAGVEIAGEAHLVVLGTHFDKYLKKLQQKGENLETLDFKNNRIRNDFKDYKQWIIEYKPAKKAMTKRCKSGKKKKTKEEKAQLIFPVNCLSREKEEKEIAQKIRQLASRCYIRAKVPIRWFLIQLEINELKSSGKDIVAVGEVVGIGSCLEMSRGEVIAALRYFHDLTVCLYFHKVLPGVVFLTPNLLFKKLTQLASVTLQKRECVVTSEMSEQMSQQGVFTKAIFGCFPDGFEPGLFTIDNFLKLMVHLLVICPLSDGESYYMPSVLQHIDNPISGLEKAFFNVEPLCLSWKDTVPVGLFPSLIQYLQGPTNEKFSPHTKVTNYHNKVTLCYTETFHRVVFFEMPSFIGIAHNAPSTHSSIILDEIRKGIQHVVKALNMKEEMAHPRELHLCRIAGCESASTPHVCHITADSLVCSLDYEIKMSLDKICHKPWKG